MKNKITMKKIFYSVFMLTALTFTTSCGGGENKENHEEHKKTTTDEAKVIEGMHFFGLEEFSPSEASISVDSMLTLVDSNGSYTGIIKAEIVEVCQQAGCWSKLKTSNQPVMVFYKDHFGIPIDTKPGTEVLLKGVAQIDTLDVEFQKHLLDDAKKNGESVPQEEYDAITEDKIEVSFEAAGVLIPGAEEKE